MRKLFLLALVLSSTVLGGCVAGTGDFAGMAILDDRCAGASTGDQYRYCLEVGPREAGVELN